MHKMTSVALIAGILLISVASAANFNDDDYHEYIVYTVDTPKVDILIVPPASPYYVRDLYNIEASVQMWIDGIQELAPTWLAQGLEINYYTLGYDTVPPEALADPEVVIVSTEYNPVLLLGIGLQTPWGWCHGLDLFEEAQAQGHQHEDSPWSVFHPECSDGGKSCVVLNTNFLWIPNNENERRMFDLNSHELGHCLGIGHVGDALDFDAKNYPEEDIMSYQFTPSQVHCVSSLNIKALEAVYGYLLGHPELHQHAGGYVHMSPSQYRTANCSNPDNPVWSDVLAGVPIVSGPQ